MRMTVSSEVIYIYIIIYNVERYINDIDLQLECTNGKDIELRKINIT